MRSSLKTFSMYQMESTFVLANKSPHLNTFSMYQMESTFVLAIEGPL